MLFSFLVAVMVEFKVCTTNEKGNSFVFIPKPAKEIRQGVFQVIQTQNGAGLNRRREVIRARQTMRH